MKTTEQDYTPFGEEWEKEIMKLPKKSIIERLKKSLLSQEFINVEDELPPAKKQVIAKLISENGKEYKTMAIYIPPRTILAEDFMMNHDDSDFYEYDEEKDNYYVFEGWWEWQTVTDVNWKIYDKVIGWRPIERK